MGTTGLVTSGSSVHKLGVEIPSTVMASTDAAAICYSANNTGFDLTTQSGFSTQTIDLVKDQCKKYGLDFFAYHKEAYLKDIDSGMDATTLPRPGIVLFNPGSGRELNKGSTEMLKDLSDGTFRFGDMQPEKQKLRDAMLDKIRQTANSAVDKESSNDFQME